MSGEAGLGDGRGSSGACSWSAGGSADGESELSSMNVVVGAGNTERIQGKEEEREHNGGISKLKWEGRETGTAGERRGSLLVIEMGRLIERRRNQRKLC